ncbi:MAG: response regulator [Elusimicrobia bacterium]|nr:response regulator [Elusimicrobiota bacterium]
METPPQPLAEPKDKRILVVDDDENIRGLLELGARQEGFAVATAVDGAEAARKIPEFRPDLIVTDLMMPAQGGYELIRSLQGTDHGAVPVIVITGRKLDDSTKEMFRREGNVIQVLAKPLSLNAFTLALHQILRTQPPQGQRSRGLNERRPGLR